MTKVLLLGLLFVNSSVFANTTDWGEIRLFNESGFHSSLAFNCWDKNGNGGSGWKRVSRGSAKSCRGAYMRVDVVGSNSKYYFWRSNYGCNTQLMQITLVDWGRFSVVCK